jgi:predicted ATPase
MYSPPGTTCGRAEWAVEVVKHRTFEALLGLVGERAAHRPLALAIEDLHWADTTSAEFLTFLSEHLAGSCVLLVCTYRPDFASLWSSKSYHSVITLPPLAPPEGYQILTALLGTAHIQDELAALVLDKADGLPFFLEELVKALQETGAIAQVEGRWRLTSQATGMLVPDTVEEGSWPVSIGCSKGPQVCPDGSGHGPRV